MGGGQGIVACTGELQAGAGGGWGWGTRPAGAAAGLDPGVTLVCSEALPAGVGILCGSDFRLRCRHHWHSQHGSESEPQAPQGRRAARARTGRKGQAGPRGDQVSPSTARVMSRVKRWLIFNGPLPVWAFPEQVPGQQIGPWSGHSICTKASHRDGSSIPGLLTAPATTGDGCELYRNQLKAN